MSMSDQEFLKILSRIEKSESHYPAARHFLWAAAIVATLVAGTALFIVFS